MAVDVTDAQRRLLQLIREHQFGRIEHLRVHAGQPILDDPNTNVIRAARLGGRNAEKSAPHGTEFELNQAVRDLFAELALVQDGVIVMLEFRHGLPWLIEITQLAR